MIRKRNIKTIAPLLADNFLDSKGSLFNVNQYWDFINKNSARLGSFKKYLICKLCESWVIGISNDLDSLKIKLNDFSTYVFADTVIDKFHLPIDIGRISFPITIELKGSVKVDYHKVDEFGNLYKTMQLDVNELFCEQITRIDDRIEIVFHFWKSNFDENRPGEQIIMIASAQNLVVKEEQEQAWNEIFGQSMHPYYQYFKKRYVSNRFLSCHADYNKIIEECEKRNEGKLTSSTIKTIQLTDSISAIHM